MYNYTQYTIGSKQNNNDHKWKERMNSDKYQDESEWLCLFHFYDWVEDSSRKMIKNPSNLTRLNPPYPALSYTLPTRQTPPHASNSTPYIQLNLNYPILPHSSHSTPLIQHNHARPAIPNHQILPHPI